MAKQRDYKREYETAKIRGDSERWVKVGTTIPRDMYAIFKTIAEKNGTKAGTLLRDWIETYISENRD